MTFDSLGIKSAVYFNTQKEPFDSKDLRQAISFAINYDEITTLMTGEYGKTPNSGLINEHSKYYIETRPMEYDIEKAILMLDNLGFNDIDGDGFRELPDGSEFNPELLVQSSNDAFVRLSELIKKDLGAVGIDLRIKVVDSTTYWAITGEKGHDMMLSGLPFWALKCDKGYYTCAMDSRSMGWANIDDPAYQSIADDLRTAMDENEIEKLVEEIQKYYSDELPVIPLYSMDFFQPYSNKYEGYVTHPIWGVLSNGTFMGLHEA
jgi:peptide/nickel transport system substrate-binding protein